MEESRQERRAKREERGRSMPPGERSIRENLDPMAIARVKTIRKRLNELAAERARLKEELQTLRGKAVEGGDK